MHIRAMPYSNPLFNNAAHPITLGRQAVSFLCKCHFRPQGTLFMTKKISEIFRKSEFMRLFLKIGMIRWLLLQRGLPVRSDFLYAFKVHRSATYYLQVNKISSPSRQTPVLKIVGNFKQYLIKKRLMGRIRIERASIITTVNFKLQNYS